MAEGTPNNVDHLVESAEHGLTGFVGQRGSQRDEFTQLPHELTEAMVQAEQTGDKSVLLLRIGALMNGESQVGAISSNVLTALLEQAGINLSTEQLAVIANRNDDPVLIEQLTQQLGSLYESVVSSRLNMDRINDRGLQNINAGRKVTKPIRNNPETQVGRNDPCPCGSGKKFKKCHWGQPLPPKEEQKDSSTEADA